MQTLRLLAAKHMAQPGLADHRGVVKGAPGATGNVAAAEIRTACNFYLNDVRENMKHVTDGKVEDANAKGHHVKAAHADTKAVVDDLRQFGLFDYEVAEPRTALSDLPSGLFPSSFAPAPTYVQADKGGLINFLSPLGPTCPLLVAKSAAVLDFMARGKHPGAFTATAPEELAGGQDGPDTFETPVETHCGICVAELPDPPRICDNCEVAVCRACAFDRPCEVGESTGVRCAACVADLGGSEEGDAREEAVACGLASDIGPPRAE